MRTKWYYQSMGAQIGPVDSRELLGKVRAGEVTASTLIRKNDSQWVEAADVGGLFEEASKPVVHRLCPYCGVEVKETPPCNCPGCERYIFRVYQRHEISKVVVPTKRPESETSLPDEGQSRMAKVPSANAGRSEEGQGLIAMLRGWIRHR